MEMHTIQYSHIDGSTRSQDQIQGPVYTVDSTCTTPEFDTASSSVPYFDRTLKSKTIDCSRENSPRRNGGATVFGGFSVFQLLQTQNVQKNTNTELDLVTTWFDEMDLYKYRGRKEVLDRIVSHVDGLLIVKAPLVNRSVWQKRRRIGRSRASVSQVSQPYSDGIQEPLHRRHGYGRPFQKRLSCPVVKHNPRRYDYVANSCTERFGFPTPGKLVEHLKRVHSLKVPCCTVCKQRFSGRTKSHAERAQALHAILGKCEPKELTEMDPEWMAEEQDVRFTDSVIQGQSSTAEEKWRSIYRQIFVIPENISVPDPYYDYLIPSHLTIHHNNNATSYSQEQIGSTEHVTTEPLGSINHPRGSGGWTQVEAEHLKNTTLPTVDPWQSWHSRHDLPVVSSTALLTAQSLDLNETNLQPWPYEHGVVYQGQDSGYQSLGQESGLETETLLGVCKRVIPQDSPSEEHPELSPSITQTLQQDFGFDLIGPGLDALS